MIAAAAAFLSLLTELRSAVKVSYISQLSSLVNKFVPRRCELLTFVIFCCYLGTLHAAYEQQCCGDVVIASTQVCCGDEITGLSYSKVDGRSCCGTEYIQTDRTACCRSSDMYKVSLSGWQGTILLF